MVSVAHDGRLMPLEIHLLAGFEVRLGGVTLNRWQRAAAKRLLKLLAIAPHHSLPADQLAAAFWPNDLGDKVRQRLHHLVYLLNEALRSAAPPSAASAATPVVHSAVAESAAVRRVELRDGLVRLDHGPGLWIDIDHFEAELAQALALAVDAPTRAVALQAALALYTGSLLPGDATDTAFAPRREQLQQRALLGLHALAEAQQRCGQLSEAVNVLNRAVVMAPSDESAHCKLMLLHAKQGQRDAVERQYHACKAALALALGVLPSAPTHQTYRDAMLKDGAPLASIAQANPAPLRWVPPTPLVTLIDRQALLTQIKLSLAQDSQRLLTLLGPGGLGKTQLSLRVAHDLAPSWRHGACFVSLAEVGADGVLECIRRALHCADPASRDVAALITEHLRDKQLLLVLDNCEHVVQSLGLLTPLLSQAPWVKVLATSRRPLNLTGERILHVPPLKPTLGSAVKLFIERARAVSPGFKLDASTRADVLAITQRLDGVPLSIELVAARAHSFAPSALKTALEAGFAATVAGGGADRPERHQSLQQSLAWSHQLLQPQDQLVLQQAALFRAPFELAALQSLCPAASAHFTQTAQTLHELGFLATAVADALALPGPPPVSPQSVSPGAVSPQPARLHLPAGTLDFLRSLPTQPQHASPTELGKRLFAQWFADRAEALDAVLLGVDTAKAQQAQAELDADHDNHFVALEFAQALVGAEPALAARLVARLAGALSRYWRQCGAWARADVWISRACELGPRLDAALHLDLLLRAASYWFESQRFELAQGQAQRAMVVAQPLHDITLQSRATLLFAAASYHLGQAQAAVKPLLKTSALARAAGREDIDTVAQNNLGNCYLTAGQLALAGATFAACDAKWGEQNTQARTAAVLNLAVVAHYKGQREQAMGLASRALAQEQSGLPRPARMALVWARTSWMWCCHGDAPQAEQALQQAQTVAQQAQLPVWLHICTAQHGKILLVRGQPQAALAVLSRSVRDCHNVTDPWDVLDSSLWLLRAQLQLTDGLPAARALLGRIVSHCGPSWRHEHPRILETAAACLVASQDFRHAGRAWRQAQALRHAQGSKRFAFDQAQARQTQSALRAKLGRDWQTLTTPRTTSQAIGPKRQGPGGDLVWLRNLVL
jgi:predicted ATPase/DNA-binding SARP family transcriptional activator/tetratricopeptide (TPR) repeat protein